MYQQHSNWFKPPPLCVCPKPGFPMLMVNDLMLEVMVYVLDINGAVDHHCLSCLFMTVTRTCCWHGCIINKVVLILVSISQCNVLNQFCLYFHKWPLFNVRSLFLSPVIQRMDFKIFYCNYMCLLELKGTIYIFNKLLHIRTNIESWYKRKVYAIK